MNCQDTKELLNSYLDNELTTNEIKEIQEHLEKCPACSQELEQLSRFKTKFRQTLASSALTSRSNNTSWNRILARIQEGEPERANLGYFKERIFSLFSLNIVKLATVFAIVIAAAVTIMMSLPRGTVIAIPESSLTEPPAVTQEAVDDLIPTPGGYAYRGNVHQVGEPDVWPGVDTTEATIGDDDSIDIRYRDWITTGTGETRNNMIVITAPFTIDKLKLGVANMPGNADISVEEICRWSRPINVIAPVLAFSIGENVKPGLYIFDIGIAINGNDYEFIPCAIEVLPALLTEQEKTKVVEIALGDQNVSEWLQGNTDYIIEPVNWYAIVWDNEGKASTWWYLGYEKIENNEKPDFIDSDFLDSCVYYYPGVTIALGKEPIYQMQTAIDLEAGKVVMAWGPLPNPGQFKNLAGHPR